MAYPELPLRSPPIAAALRAASVPDGESPHREFARAMRQALAEQPHRISPKFFYDAAGSALFDRICELPEYYPTRTELALLQARAHEMAEVIGPDAEIVEFGAGASRKIRMLLQALAQPRRFVPIDISGEHLHAAAAELRADHPGLDVQPIAADFTRPLTLPARHPAARRRVGFFPGSSIGNFTPDEALRFLRQSAEVLAAGGGEGGGLLVGVDLVKEPARLHAAYNDAAGVTAAFNRNLLARANRELGANFDLEGFDHYAYYEPRLQRVEMHLVSRVDQQVRVCGHRFDFAQGDSLHTENSHKFSVAGFRALAEQAGYRPQAVWCDAERLFSVHWLALPT